MKPYNLVLSTLVIGKNYEKYLDLCLKSLSTILSSTDSTIKIIVGCDVDDFTPIKQYDNIEIIPFRISHDLPTHNKGFHYFLKLFCIEKAMQYSRRIIHIDCDILFKSQFGNVLDILDISDISYGIYYRNLISNPGLLENKLGHNRKFNMVQQFFGFTSEPTITPDLMSEAFIFFNLEQIKLKEFLECWRSLIPFLTKHGLLYGAECKDIYFSAKKCNIAIKPLIPVVGQNITTSVVYLNKPIIKWLEAFASHHSIDISAVDDFLISNI